MVTGVSAKLVWSGSEGGAHVEGGVLVARGQSGVVGRQALVAHDVGDGRHGRLPLIARCGRQQHVARLPPRAPAQEQHNCAFSCDAQSALTRSSLAAAAAATPAQGTVAWSATKGQDSSKAHRRMGVHLAVNPSPFVDGPTPLSCPDCTLSHQILLQA